MCSCDFSQEKPWHAYLSVHVYLNRQTEKTLAPCCCNVNPLKSKNYYTNKFYIFEREKIDNISCGKQYKHNIHAHNERYYHNMSLSTTTHVTTRTLAINGKAITEINK